MTLVVSCGPVQEAAWRDAERRTVAVMGTINLPTADLVRTIAVLDATERYRSSRPARSPSARQSAMSLKNGSAPLL